MDPAAELSNRADQLVLVEPLKSALWMNELHRPCGGPSRDVRPQFETRPKREPLSPIGAE